MSTLLEGLRKYFQETPQDKVMSDWASLEEFDKVGPTIDEFIEISKKYYTMEAPDNKFITPSEINNIINNNPKFYPSGLLLQ